jgi:hypothetical protein
MIQSRSHLPWEPIGFFVVDNARLMKAVKATVTIGSDVTIDGLRLVDGTFAVSVSQFAALISIPLKHSSKDFKSLLGEGFQFPQCTSEIHPKKVNVLSLSQVETLLTKYDRKGNVYAQNN